ncbi:hypothetical protein TSUD_278290 [Trifolium subterraneum]|uniref:Uncharacterized protein n=1 Tax=Trifolium subterraneum TaxID=3900 RepID=A0A2Z6MGV2_TRISU|nr:hypothetical protein TSUD_278290 [Trifolium subterraneum]
MFKGLVGGGKKIKDMLRVIWFANVFVTWKARNAVNGFAIGLQPKMVLKGIKKTPTIMRQTLLEHPT